MHEAKSKHGSLTERSSERRLLLCHEWPRAHSRACSRLSARMRRDGKTPDTHTQSILTHIRTGRGAHTRSLHGTFQQEAVT